MMVKPVLELGSKSWSSRAKVIGQNITLDLMTNIPFFAKYIKSIVNLCRLFIPIDKSIKSPKREGLVIIISGSSGFNGKPDQKRPEYASEIARSCDSQRSAVDQPDLQVYPFGKSVAMPALKVVQDALLPILKRFDEGFQRSKAAGFHSFDPRLQLQSGTFPVTFLFEPVPKVFFQLVTFP